MGWGATVPPRTAAPLSIRATGLYGYSMGERMHNARHAKPASTTRRILLGGLAAVTAAGLGTLAFTSTGNAATTHQPSALVRAIVTGATVGIDGTTYRAVPVSTRRQYPTRAYRRTCRAFARWNAAGIPTRREARTLARDALRLGASLPDQVLYSDVSGLVLSMVAHTDGSADAVRVAHDCGND